MSTTTEIIAQHWAFIVFIVIAFGLCAFMLTGGWVEDDEKHRNQIKFCRQADVGIAH
jgi:NADH:ubiquinone oxidoreductase subunit 3 (subunit A)